MEDAIWEISRINRVSKNSKEVEKVCRDLSKKNSPVAEGIQVLGPAPAPLELVRGKTRWEVFGDCTKDKKLQTFMRHWLIVWLYLKAFR